MVYILFRLIIQKNLICDTVLTLFNTIVIIAL